MAIAYVVVLSSVKVPRADVWIDSGLQTASNQAQHTFAAVSHVFLRALTGEVTLSLLIVKVLTVSCVSADDQASVSLWNGLVRCWSSDVFIGSLVQSFASATGQMIGMYADWVQRTVAEATTRFASDVCAAAIADCTTLSAAVTSELLQLASAASPANRSALSELLQGSSKQLRDAATASLTKLVALLTSACTPALASVETITSLYWMRKGVPAPTKACQFVPRFLKPLQEFLATDAGVLTESWHRHTLVVDVLSAVTGQYSVAISALIAKRENLESGLGWLNKAKQGVCPHACSCLLWCCVKHLFR